MKTTDDLKVMLSQWRTQFPNLYLRAVRGDCSVTVLTKANPLTVEDLDYIEKTYMPLPEVTHAPSFEPQFDEEAEEVKPKKERKARKSRTHPSNFPM